MKRELLLSTLVLAGGIAIAGVILAVPAWAQEGAAPDIQFPVAELGNCRSEQACKTYCDAPGHLEACLAFAEKSGLMSQAEIATARKFESVDFAGPGGCTSKNSCETYCNDVAHINECVAFAEANDVIPPAELAEAKKVQAAIARGVKPPACGNKRSCDTYCRAPANMKECIAFGEAAGFIQGKELEDAKKMIAALERGVTPPACNNKEECDVFCAEEANFPQCLAFGEAAGFISAEEAAMARKTGGKGPGNCRGREECEAFCESPSNQEACFAFAKEHGLISPEDLMRMEEGRAKFSEGFRQAPPDVSECLKATVGEEVLTKLERGEGFPPRDLGEKMQACFQNFRPPEGGFQGPPGEGEPRLGIPPGEGFGGPPQGEFKGPGGCTSPEECRAYCEANPETCGGFGPPSGGKVPRYGEVPRPDGVPPSGSFPQGYEQKFNEQYQKQYEEQYRQRYEQYPQSAPPEGGVYPSPGTYPQPGTYSPPSGEYQTPPPPPPSSLGPQALLGLFLNIFRGE